MCNDAGSFPLPLYLMISCQNGPSYGLRGSRFVKLLKRPVSRGSEIG